MQFVNISSLHKMSVVPFLYINIELVIFAILKIHK